MTAPCRLAICVGKEKLTLPCDMPRDQAEALGKAIENAGAVTWYLPPNDQRPLADSDATEPCVLCSGNGWRKVWFQGRLEERTCCDCRGAGVRPVRPNDK